MWPQYDAKVEPIIQLQVWYGTTSISTVQKIVLEGVLISYMQDTHTLVTRNKSMIWIVGKAQQNGMPICDLVQFPTKIAQASALNVIWDVYLNNKMRLGPKYLHNMPLSTIIKLRKIYTKTKCNNNNGNNSHQKLS